MIDKIKYFMDSKFRFKNSIFLLLFLLSFDLSAQMGMAMQASLVSQSYNYSPKYRAALNYVAVDATRGVPPFLFQDRKREDVFFRALDFTKIDHMLLLTTYGDKNWALLNMANPGTNNGSITGSAMLYTRGIGFTNQSTNTTYINTNFTPSSGTNYTQNEAGFIIYCPSVDIGRNGQVFAGATDGTQGLTIDLRNSTDVFTWRLNNNATNTLTNTTTKGLYHIRRTSSTAVQVFKDGSNISTVSRTSTGRPTQPIYLGALNSSGTSTTPTSRYCGLWIAGASMSGSESAISTAWSTYLSTDAADAISFPSFPSYTSYSSDLSSYLTAISDLKNKFSYSYPVVELLQSTITASSLQYQGIGIGSNKMLYGTTSGGTTILKIDPTTTPETVSQIGSIAAGSQKYGGAPVLVGTELFFCPYNAKSVMVLDCTTDAISYFDQSGSTASATTGGLTGTAKWWGFYLGSDGYIYGIAYDAHEVIKVNPATHAITFIDGTGTVSYNAGNLTASAKSDAGIPYGDYVYGSASDATQLEKIDVVGGTVSQVGSYAAGANKYAFMTVLPSGKLGMYGYNNSDMQIFDPSNNSTTTAGGANFGGSAIHIFVSTLMPNGKTLVFNGPNDEPTGSFYTYDDDTQTLTRITDNSINSVNGAVQIGALAENGAIYLCPSTGGKIYKVYLAKKSMTIPDNFKWSRYMK